MVVVVVVAVVEAVVVVAVVVLLVVVREGRQFVGPRCDKSMTEASLSI